MKEIQLNKFSEKNKGKYVALVDDDMFEYLNQWNWYAYKSNSTLYVEREDHGKTIKMHRLLMNTPDGMLVDHIDHNGLNNQKSNLRNCTHGQNMQNRKPYGKSKFKGVILCQNRFRAQINLGKRTLYLGRFKSEIEAAKAYDAKAKEIRGEFTSLNFK